MQEHAATGVAETDPTRAGRMSGVRAGAFVFLGIGIANAGNYLFQLVAARWLGPAQYGDLAALVAVAALVTLPLGGLQPAVARDVAALEAEGRSMIATARLRHTLVIALGVGALLTATLIFLAPAIRHLVGVGSLAALAMTLALVLPAFLMPVLLGWLQGIQRFGFLAAALAVGPTTRIVLLGAAIATGTGIAGAAGATLAAAVAALAIPLALLHAHKAAGSARSSGHFDWRRGARRTAPVIAGLLALTALSTVDVVVASATLPSHEAGIYGSASLIARVILYLSAAVVTVLLPKVSERSTLQRETRSILSASLLVTGGLAFVATALYALLSGLLVAVTVGSEYADAAPLLWLFALTMSGYALLNVLLFADLGAGGTRMVKLLGCGVVAQALGFALFHGSVWQLLAVDACTALVLLAVHEIALDRSLTRSIRTSRATLAEISFRRSA